jgi:hypothetical protein
MGTRPVISCGIEKYMKKSAQKRFLVTEVTRLLVAYVKET